MATLRLASALLLCLALSTIVPARAQVTPAPFNLINPYLPDDLKAVWTEVQDRLFGTLRAIGGRTGEQDCPGVARVWWRLFFHDCGTFNKKYGTGGCDASIQFETDRFENNADTGIPGSLGFYRFVIGLTEPNHPGLTLGLSDFIVLAGFVATAACKGPQILFTPGRVDATGPNGDLLLPGPGDAPDVIMATMKRMGLTKKHAIAIISAGHTMANLTAPMDATPTVFDGVYFKQVLGQLPNSPGVLKSDLDLLTKTDLKNIFEQYDKNNVKWFADVVKASHKMSYFGQPAALKLYLGVNDLDYSEDEGPYTKKDEDIEEAGKEARYEGWKVQAAKRSPYIDPEYPVSE